MIEQGLFKRYFVGRDGFIWWMGQIAPESSWKDNKPGSPVATNSDIRGFGERYRVRIMGYHTADVDRIPDEELPWAYVMYPVTAGSGGRSGSQSANISQGDFVFGFFMDGEDAQMPVIMGILGNNEYAAVSKNITNARFVPFSGYTESDKVSKASVNVDKGGEVVQQTGAQTTEGTTESQGDQTGSSNNSVVNEAATQSNSKRDAASKAASEENTEPLAQPSRCEPIPMGKIQKDIQNAIVEIQKLQKSIYDYELTVTIGGEEKTIGDIQDDIDKISDKIIEKVSEVLKWIFVETEKYVLQKVNNTLKDTYFLLFPNERPGLKTAVEDVNDLIACLFRQFIAALLQQIGSFINEAIQKVINGATCLIDNLIANTLGQILGVLTGAINQALGAVNSLIGQTVSIAGDVLGLVVEILSFLSCEEEPKCGDINEWNILSGASPLSKADFDSIISKAENIASTFTEAIDLDNYDFNLNFDGVFDDALDACNIGPVTCGPPLAQFWSGPDSFGAAANLVIGTAGEVIGVDMLSFGVGYEDGNTYANVYDECGSGVGAVIEPIVGDYIDDNGDTQTGVIDAIILEPGTGYLAAPNGSKGGNGYTWAKPQDTIVKHPDGSYDVPKPPGYVITVNPGDEVTLPPGSNVITEPQPGDQGGGEEIPGGDTYIVLKPGVFTSPQIDYSRVSGNYPVLSTGSYPVIMYLCEVLIVERGFNYSSGDKIVIQPDIGAVAEPKFDAQGRVISIKVTQTGEGFTEYPTLYIKSETGYNAVLRPKLCIDRVGSDELKEPTSQDKVVTVIDCVGKF